MKKLKKIIAVVLLVLIVSSCFSVNSFAGCSHNYPYTAQQSYHYYDYVSHIIRIKYICTNCGSVIHIEEHQQSHSDRNNDGLCDYCSAGSSNSGGSSSSSGSTGSFILDVLLFILSIPLGIIMLPFNLIGMIFGL